jgi:hypothetical protein
MSTEAKSPRPVDATQEVGKRSGSEAEMKTSAITSVGTAGSPPRVASAFLKKISASGAGSHSS